MSALGQVYRLLCRLRPTIVHTHMAKAGAVGRTAAVLYNRTAGRRKPARIVHTYHGHVLEGYFGRAKTSLFIQTERALAAVTDRIVAISPRIRDELITDYRIGSAAQYAVVPLGFDLASFAAVDAASRVAARRALAVPTDAPTLVTVGRLTAIKQHELLLRTVREVARARPNVVLLVAGDGERRVELAALADELGIAANVRWLGWRRDLATVYAASDVFVLTSRNEGTPVALIEAMASGVPGVSTDVGGVRDVIAHSGVGMLAAASAESIAQCILQLLSTANQRVAMGMAARALVLERFTQERLVDDIATLYRELL
jgi:glycosyltransferase involved in cell wall biosynthesis